ncbi:MAG TPA: hypothetical protein VEG30_04700 [Terriglobales bacterium]|nr:hypothetical protein [Terriglobales bacterium]
MKLIRGSIGLLSLLILLGSTAMGQPGPGHVRVDDESAEHAHHLGFPEDWSSRHVVMTGNLASEAIAAGWKEPRHVYNMVRRQMADEAGAPVISSKNAVRIDWAVSLENGFVPANQYPAKYRFDVTAQDCNGDYVVFGLNAPSGQANLVGINNLYTEKSPPCNSGSPWVAFAYNTFTQGGGHIRTSPTISVDGTKVAFVESATLGSFFHVLVLPNPIPAPPLQTGTVLSPSTPSSCTTPTAPNCMTTVQISTGANTDSSPYIDYSTDTAYVGTDDGKLYKITPVFGGGQPQVVNDSNWPVTVVANGLASKVVTDAIVDSNADRIFMGDGNGYLYAISLTSPHHGTSARVAIGWVGHGAGTGVIDAPIVVNDSANPAVDQVFAFTGCSNVNGTGGAITQLPANFTSSFTASNSNTVDLGSASGAGDCTTGNVHAGAFDNQFWIGGTTAGHILGCGFVSGTTGNPLIPSNPKMYMYSFVNHTLQKPASTATTWVVNNSVGDECSPLTEFYNGTTDRMFFGVGSVNDGFLESSTLTGTASQPNCSNPPTSSCVAAPRALGGTSGIVVDNQVTNGGTNIYFSTLVGGSVNGGNCKVSGGAATPYCAVKLTQSALQ